MLGCGNSFFLMRSGVMVKCMSLIVATVLAGAEGVMANPELEKLAKVHRETTRQQEGDKAAEIRALALVYLKKLEDADRKAMRRGEIAEVEVLKREIEVIEKGVYLQNAPDGLPSSVERARGRFVKDVNKIKGEYAEKQAKLDETYFKALGDLAFQSSSDENLAERIEQEKERVLVGAFGEITDLRSQIVGTSWINTNNPKDIRTFRPEGRMAHWRYEVIDRDVVIIHWNETAGTEMVLSKDGNALIEGDLVWERFFPDDDG